MKSPWCTLVSVLAVMLTLGLNSAAQASVDWLEEQIRSLELRVIVPIHRSEIDALKKELDKRWRAYFTSPDAFGMTQGVGPVIIDGEVTIGYVDGPQNPERRRRREKLEALQKRIEALYRRAVPDFYFGEDRGIEMSHGGSPGRQGPSH